MAQGNDIFAEGNGPFDRFLAAPQYSPPPVQPSGHEGAAGQAANIITNFLKGMSQGRIMQVAKAEQQRHRNMQAIMSTRNLVASSQLPDEVKAQHIANLEKAAQSYLVMDDNGKPHKPMDANAGPGAHVWNFITHGLLDKIVGPGAQKVTPIDLTNGAIADATAAIGDQKQQLPYLREQALGKLSGVVTNMLEAGGGPTRVSQEQIRLSPEYQAAEQEAMKYGVSPAMIDRAVSPVYTGQQQMALGVGPFSVFGEQPAQTAKQPPAAQPPAPNVGTPTSAEADPLKQYLPLVTGTVPQPQQPAVPPMPSNFTPAPPQQTEAAAPPAVSTTNGQAQTQDWMSPYLGRTAQTNLAILKAHRKPEVYYMVDPKTKRNVAVEDYGDFRLRGGTNQEILTQDMLNAGFERRDKPLEPAIKASQQEIDSARKSLTTQISGMGIPQKDQKWLTEAVNAQLAAGDINGAGDAINRYISNQSNRENARAMANALTTGQKMQQVHLMRSDLNQNKVMENFRVVDDRMSMIQSHFKTAQNLLMQGKSPGAADILLLREIAKISDPMTGVREGEYTTLKNVPGLLSRVGLLIENLTNDQNAMLTEHDRKVYAQLAGDYHKYAKQKADAVLRSFEPQAKMLGVTTPELRDMAGLRPMQEPPARRAAPTGSREAMRANNPFGGGQAPQGQHDDGRPRL